MFHVADFRIVKYHGPNQRIPDRYRQFKDDMHAVYWDHHNGLTMKDRPNCFGLQLQLFDDGIKYYERIQCTYEFKWIVLENELIEFMVKSKALYDSGHRENHVCRLFPPWWWLQMKFRQASAVPIPSDLQRVVFGFL